VQKHYVKAEKAIIRVIYLATMGSNLGNGP